VPGESAHLVDSTKSTGGNLLDELKQGVGIISVEQIRQLDHLAVGVFVSKKKRKKVYSKRSQD
jgi:hypothetical protein